MSESARPSVQSVQKTLIIGALIGLILGCAIGAALVGFYVRQNPPVYEGGAYPNELTNAYQKHYLAMVIDSFIVNQQPDVAIERLKTFNQRAQIRALGERSAAYVAAGRGDEAQLINNLAISLKNSESWNENTIKAVVSELTNEYQTEPARSQAISTFSALLLQGQVPVPSEGAPVEGAAPEEPPQPPPAQPQPPEAAQPPPPPSASGGGPNWLLYGLCCLLLIVIGAIVYLVGRRRFEARRLPTKQEIDWKGEGAPPLKTWSGTYTLGQDLYDEFFTIETDENVFLGEAGMGILEALPGTSPKQVVAFDVGLFDKTDITTISRVVMSEHAYNDETIRSKVEANPQAEPVLAEPGKAFTFDTTALRVEAKIDAMDYAAGSNVYFEKLTVSLNLFLKEGADLRQGEMDVPDEFKT